MELEEALKGGLIDMNKQPSNVPDDEVDDASILYKEFKNAPDEASGLAALKQLVRLLK
jgi:hypothetical protein